MVRSTFVIGPPGYCVENRLEARTDGWREVRRQFQESREEVTELGPGWWQRDGGKRPESGCIWKVEPTGLSKGLDVNQWEVEMVTLRMAHGPLAGTAVWMV